MKLSDRSAPIVIGAATNYGHGFSKDQYQTAFNYSINKVEFHPTNRISSEIQLSAKNVNHQKNSSMESDTYGSTILSPPESGSNESEMMDSSKDESIIVFGKKKISNCGLNLLTPPPSQHNAVLGLKRLKKKPLCFTPSPVRVSKVKKSKRVPRRSLSKKKSGKRFEISQNSFKRIVLEILKEQSLSKLRIAENAIEALQEASESLLTEHFVKLGRMMDLSNKQTLTINTLMLYNCARANV